MNFFDLENSLKWKTLENKDIKKNYFIYPLVDDGLYSTKTMILKNMSWETL